MNMVSGSQKYLPTLNEWGTSFVALFYKVINLTFYILQVKRCNSMLNIQQLYILPTVFMCSAFIWEQTATCATYSIN